MKTKRHGEQHGEQHGGQYGEQHGAVFGVVAHLFRKFSNVDATIHAAASTRCVKPRQAASSRDKPYACCVVSDINAALLCAA